MLFCKQSYKRFFPNIKKKNYKVGQNFKKIRCFIKWAKSSVLGQFQKFFRDFYFMVKICF